MYNACLSGSPEPISLLPPFNLTSFLKGLSIFRYNLSFGNMNHFFDFINCYCSTLLPTKIWNSFEIICLHLASFKLSDTHFIISVTVYEVLDNFLEVRWFFGTAIALVCTHPWFKQYFIEIQQHILTYT